ncbi:MAG TPA: thioesterase family protein [Acidimicrobiales bacterium]
MTAPDTPPDATFDGPTAAPTPAAAARPRAQGSSATVSPAASGGAARVGEGAFDRATAVVSRDGADGVFDVVVDPGWSIGAVPNGGYQLALLGRAAVAAAAQVEGPEHPHVLAATAQYVTPSPPGPAEVHTEVLRRGRRVSQVRARLVTDGRTNVDVSFTVGRLDAATEPWWTDAVMPAATPFDECPRSPSVGAAEMPLSLLQQIDQRMDPIHRFDPERPSGSGQFWAWLAFPDGRPHDPLSLLLAVDAVPPATFGLGTTGWVPTLSLTTYVRAVPAPGPVLVHQRARLVEDELVDEVCDVWDGRGRLVAQATQLAAVRTSGPPAVPTDPGSGKTAPG